MKTISKSELARRFEVVPSMVTKYIAKGMPVTATGRINWSAAQKWRSDNISSERSGSFAARQRRSGKDPGSDNNGLAEIESLAGEDWERAAHRRLLDQILLHRDRVAGILADCGVSDTVLLHCADDVFAALVLGFAGDLDPYDWDHDDDIPLVDTDIAGLFKKYDLGEVTPELVEKADEMAFAAFKRAEEGNTANAN